jgi:hypothetical protein
MGDREQAQAGEAATPAGGPVAHPPRQLLKWETIKGIVSPGKRAWDRRIRNGTILAVVVTPLLTMVSRTLDRYATEMAATQEEARLTLRALRTDLPDAVKGLAPLLGAMSTDLEALRQGNAEVHGWVQGRLRCPACVCPTTCTEMKFFPSPK